MGEIQAEPTVCQPFNAREFRRVLSQVRALTMTPSSEWKTKLPRLCASAGVCFILTKEIPRASVSGAARWLMDKALIQLSLKYKRDDQFWFSFFHEAGHLLLHGKKRLFVDYGMRDDTEEERQANRFARAILIPPQFERSFPRLKSKKDIRRFAATIGIAPGIVVGRLQREKCLKPNYCNDLKVTYEWA
jgi:Zn-dependent peptidase ImmA (M78 family)